MLVTGIVLTAMAPVGIWVAGVGLLLCTDKGFARCDYQGMVYSGLGATAALLGVGIPLIVTGGRREPVTARLMPWIRPDGGGLGVRAAF
jgi:hypothetical protein